MGGKHELRLTQKPPPSTRVTAGAHKVTLEATSLDNAVSAHCDFQLLVRPSNFNRLLPRRKRRTVSGAVKRIRVPPDEQMERHGYNMSWKARLYNPFLMPFYDRLVVYARISDYNFCGGPRPPKYFSSLSFCSVPLHSTAIDCVPDVKDRDLEPPVENHPEDSRDHCLVNGIEDLRLFLFEGELWGLGAVYVPHEDHRKRCIERPVLVQLDAATLNPLRFISVRLARKSRTKNWIMTAPTEGVPGSLDVVTDREPLSVGHVFINNGSLWGAESFPAEPLFEGLDWRGSTNYLNTWHAGSQESSPTLLTVVHRKDQAKQYYHMFVETEAHWPYAAVARSDDFCFAADGLRMHTKRAANSGCSRTQYAMSIQCADPSCEYLWISYGVGDCHGMVMKVASADVRKLLVHRKEPEEEEEDVAAPPEVATAVDPVLPTDQSAPELRSTLRDR